MHDAIAALEAALTVRAKEKETVPMGWAAAQNNLDLARHWLGDLTDDPEELDKANAAYRLCLEVRTDNADPFPWAKTQWNLADLALVRHRLGPAPGLLDDARGGVLAAWQVFADGSAQQTGRCDALLARIDAARQG